MNDTKTPLLMRTANPHFDLDDELREILGRVCIHCGGIAGLLRHSGYQCKPKAEDEQAVTIHFLLSKYFEFGPGKWREEAEKELKAMAAQLDASRTDKANAELSDPKGSEQ